MGPQTEAPTIERGLAILEILNEPAKGLTLTEISKMIGSSKNSTSQLIQTLITKDYMVQGDNCVAAPIRDSHGTLVAAGIKNSFPTVRNEVKSAAAKIERRLRP